MDKTIETIVRHPIASTIVITSIARGIAVIITAVRGGNIDPVMMVTNNISKELTGTTVEV